jgi:hypothetical protein
MPKRNNVAQFQYRLTWIVGFLVWTVGDYVTTNIGIEQYNYQEANFIAMYFLELGGYSGLVGSKIVIAVILFLLAKLFIHEKYRIVVPLLLLIIGVSVTMFNVYKIHSIGVHVVMG